MWGSLCGHTAEMPQAGMNWPREEAGCPGAGRGQLVPDLFNGQRFSTLVMGGGGCWAGPLLLNTHHLGRGWWGSETWRPRPCSPAWGWGRGGVHRRGLCFSGKEGPPPFSRQPSWSSPIAGCRTAPSWVSLFFCQHSVNTQYCIKAINSHFKETETQFSHQSQEQRLGGLRNVTTQLAAPPPPTPHPTPPQVEGDTEQWAVPG